MAQSINRRRMLRLATGAGLLALLAACDTTSINLAPLGSSATPSGPGQSVGSGPVRVALLLPLSGDAALAQVGTSMANAAQLAMAYVAASPRIGDNITLEIKDTGPSPQGAAAQASAAIAEGAALILGPLKADQVEAAGAAAQSANVPLIGFSNNPSAAAPGVYLLNVLPETELHRSLGYAAAHGRRAIAGIFPTTDFGRAQQTAYQQATAELGVASRGAYSFNSQTDLRNIVGQLAAQLKSGAVDALVIPDRATAPAVAALLQQAGVPEGKALLIGSADWDNDPTIIATPYLAGAIYPTVDDSGYRALSADYTAKFGSAPHPLATIAYTAVILANAAPLASAHYGAAQLTMPGGFNGRDGVFRFLANGQSQYALVIEEITPGGAQRIDGPKL